MQQRQEVITALIIPFSPIYLNHRLNITSGPNANEYVRGKNPMFYLNIQLYFEGISWRNLPEAPSTAKRFLLPTSQSDLLLFNSNS